MEDFLKRNGCKTIFLLAKENEKQDIDLDTKNINYLADKLVQFIEYREASGDSVSAQQVAASLTRIMPCVKMVQITYVDIYHFDYTFISLLCKSSFDFPIFC